jgi:hypothetical protein
VKLPPPSPALWLQENLLAELQADLSLSEFTRARDVLHVAELGTEGSQDSNEHLILASGSNCHPVSAGQVLPSVRAMWTDTSATALTLLIRDPATCLCVCSQESCSARRSMIPIKSGFHATTRTDRKTAKRAAKSTTAASAVP